MIKLYFMIGLPTETDNDLEALVTMVKKLRKIKTVNGRRGKLNVSVATFIPKPHTPFQWARQISLAESRLKINWLHDQLNLPGVQFKWQNPEVSWLEGLWARGDRRLSRLLIAAYYKGCRFDGWSDKFHYHLWQEALEEEGIDPDLSSSEKRALSDPLPWDHIDSRISKNFLIQEWEKALDCGFTDDCRQGGCAQCGVCDFEEIEVKTYPDIQTDSCTEFRIKTDDRTGTKNLAVNFSKLDQAKYLGHLEMVNIFLRAIKRADIPVICSQGFHPKPKISFDDPLPVGIESEQEIFAVRVPGNVRPEDLIRKLNANLPNGLVINSCQIASKKLGPQSAAAHTYEVNLRDGEFEAEKLAAFKRASEFSISQANRKGKLKKLNLKDMVVDIKISDPKRLRLTLVSVAGKTVRPAVILRNIFDVPEDRIKQAKVLKRRA